MKKSILKFFIISVAVLSGIVYGFGLTDSSFPIVYPSGNAVSYLINSLKYFIFWVLPFWWIMILGGAALSTFLYWLIRKI